MIMSPKLKEYLIIGGIGLTLLLLAFIAGRGSVPTKVLTHNVETQTVVTKIDDTKVDKLIEQINTFQQQISEMKKSIHREKSIHTNVDGSKDEKDVEDVNVDRVVQSTETKYVDRVVTQTETKYVDKVVTQIVEKDKLVLTMKPKIDFGVLVGVSVPDFSKPLGWLGGPIIYGGEVNYRLGQSAFKVGAWGLSNATFGLKLGAEF